MNSHPKATSDPVLEIIEEWVAGYEREALSEDGD